MTTKKVPEIWKEAGKYEQGLEERPFTQAENLLGQEICIEKYKVVRDAEHDGEKAIVQFTDRDGNKLLASMFSEVVIKQLQKMDEAAFPVIAKIVQPEGKRYYMLEAPGE